MYIIYHFKKFSNNTWFVIAKISDVQFYVKYGKYKQNIFEQYRSRLALIASVLIPYSASRFCQYNPTANCLHKPELNIF